MDDQQLEQIIYQVKYGELQQFNRIIECYQKQLYHYIYCIVNCTQDAEDIVQDTFLMDLNYAKLKKAIWSKQSYKAEREAKREEARMLRDLEENIRQGDLSRSCKVLDRQFCRELCEQHLPRYIVVSEPLFTSDI